LASVSKLAADFNSFYNLIWFVSDIVYGFMLLFRFLSIIQIVSTWNCGTVSI
jgi:hypothetical protein